MGLTKAMKNAVFSTTAILLALLFLEMWGVRIFPSAYLFTPVGIFIFYWLNVQAFWVTSVGV